MYYHGCDHTENGSVEDDWETQNLLRNRQSTYLPERASNVWFSVGFILGYKLRYSLGFRIEPEAKAYLLHLRRVVTMHGGRDGLTEGIARLCVAYAAQELPKAKGFLTAIQQRK